MIVDNFMTDFMTVDRMFVDNLIAKKWSYTTLDEMTVDIKWLHTKWP